MHLFRASKTLRRLLVLGGLAALLPVAGTGVAASAIASAPNRSASEPPLCPVPDSLASYRARELRVAVGPPRATLSAWVLEPASGRPALGTVVVLHGVRLDKRSMVPIGRSLADAGYRAVLVDLRGHGGSSGDHLTYGVVESHDVSELVDALEKNEGALGPLGVHGFSYGAATALELAGSDPRVRAVVAVAPFASLRHVVRDYVRWQAPSLVPALPEPWLDATIDLGAEMAEFDPDAAAPVRAVERTRAPILLVHGTSDRQVPLANSDEIARSASDHTQLLRLPGETHASILADARGVVRAASVAWFDRHLASGS